MNILKNGIAGETIAESGFPAVMDPFKDFTGFMDPHLPISLKKSTYIKVWEMESEKLNSTCLHKIRSVEDVNCWLFRYWQLVSGSFYPRTTNTVSYTHLTLPTT